MSKYRAAQVTCVRCGDLHPAFGWDQLCDRCRNRRYAVQYWREGGFESAVGKVDELTVDEGGRASALVAARRFCAETPWPKLASATVRDVESLEVVAEFGSEMYRRMG